MWLQPADEQVRRRTTADPVARAVPEFASLTRATNVFMLNVFHDSWKKSTPPESPAPTKSFA